MSPQVSHHLLLCVPNKTLSTSCCELIHSQKSGEKLKLILKKLNLDKSNRPEGIVLRSKVDCLRVCNSGPILLIWPEGTWYKKVSPDRIEAIIKCHVIEGKPIREWVFKETPLKILE